VKLELREAMERQELLVPKAKQEQREVTVQQDRRDRKVKQEQQEVTAQPGPQGPKGETGTAGSNGATGPAGPSVVAMGNLRFTGMLTGNTGTSKNSSSFGTIEVGKKYLVRIYVQSVMIPTGANISYALAFSLLALTAVPT
jgi:hypothetical protein